MNKRSKTQLVEDETEALLRSIFGPKAGDVDGWQPSFTRRRIMAGLKKARRAAAKTAANKQAAQQNANRVVTPAQAPKVSPTNPLVMTTADITSGNWGKP